MGGGEGGGGVRGPAGKIEFLPISNFKVNYQFMELY